jgi:exopolysaccharide biosynthesis polyprenyl glycosylphosphotransferase
MPIRAAAPEVLAVAVAFCVAAEVFSGGRPSPATPVAGILLVTLAGWLVVGGMAGLFVARRPFDEFSFTQQLAALTRAIVSVAWIVLAASYAFGSPLRLVQLAVFAGLALVLVPLARGVFSAIDGGGRVRRERTLIVGAGHVGQLVARKISQHPECGFELVGFVDSAPRTRRPELDGVPVLGSPEGLSRQIAVHKIDRVIVAFSSDRSEELVQILRDLECSGVDVDVVPRLFELVGPAARVGTLEGLPFLDLPRRRFTPAERIAKRAIDVVGAALLLVFTAPLIAFIAWRIRRTGDGPVLFCQTRLGLNMREFTTLKFRTMRMNASDSEHRAFIRETASSAAAPSANGLYKLERPDDVTPIGQWLRRTSLDELPQLWNVLRGEMSLVGPRPCIPYEIEHFADHHFDRFQVQPGLTGYWQVTARARATFGEALDLDVAYVHDWSLGLDLRLLAATPPALLATGATR